jgi:hypothetical protein
MRAGLGARRLAWTVVLAAVLVAAVAVPAAAAVPGELDPRFGVGGTAMTEFPSSYSGARAVAVQGTSRWPGCHRRADWTAPSAATGGS